MKLCNRSNPAEQPTERITSLTFNPQPCMYKARPPLVCGTGFRCSEIIIRRTLEMQQDAESSSLLIALLHSNIDHVLKLEQIETEGSETAQVQA